MELATKRLIIREWSPADKADLIEGINELDVSKWLLVVPHPYKKSDAERWIDNAAKEVLKYPRENLNLALMLASEKKVIGGISLTHINYFIGTGAVGFWLNQKYHRKGFMTEAVAKMLEYAFECLNLRRIEWTVFEGNMPSSSLAENFGFAYEGTKREGARCRADGNIHDEKIFGY